MKVFTRRSRVLFLLFHILGLLQPNLYLWKSYFLPGTIWCDLYWALFHCGLGKKESLFSHGHIGLWGALRLEKYQSLWFLQAVPSQEAWPALGFQVLLDVRWGLATCPRLGGGSRWWVTAEGTCGSQTAVSVQSRKEAVGKFGEERALWNQVSGINREGFLRMFLTGYKGSEQ